MIIRGIDTLEFGLDINSYLEDFQTTLDLFKEMKLKAQEENKPQEIEFNGINMQVEKSGMPFYAYRLTCKDFIIGFADQITATNTPIRVKLLSSYIWSYGAKEAINIFMDWLNYFNLNVVGNRLSRVDICADTDKVCFVPGDIKNIVTRAKSKGVHYVSDYFYNGKYFSGFTIGRGQPILARIYDKTKEMITSGKLYFIALWDQHSWNHETVWRVEFQLRREILKELKLESFDDLWQNEDRLWAYLTQEWLLLKSNNDTNVSRRKVKRKWAIIQSANCSNEVSPLVRQAVVQGDMQRLLDQTAGLVISIAASSNCDSLEKALDIVKGYSEVKLSCQKNGFQEKVNNRRQKFINNSDNNSIFVTN